MDRKTNLAQHEYVRGSVSPVPLATTGNPLLLASSLGSGSGVCKCPGSQGSRTPCLCCLFVRFVPFVCVVCGFSRGTRTSWG